jgi:hypothetical protein
MPHTEAVGETAGDDCPAIRYRLRTDVPAIIVAPCQEVIGCWTHPGLMRGFEGERGSECASIPQLGPAIARRGDQVVTLVQIQAPHGGCVVREVTDPLLKESDKGCCQLQSDESRDTEQPLA